MRSLRRLAIAALALLLAAGALPACAESRLLPPSALVLRDKSSLITGGFSMKTPEAKYNAISGAEVDARYAAIEGYHAISLHVCGLIELLPRSISLIAATMK